MKVAKTTKPTQKKVSFLLLKLHFRSNTEFSEEERDDGDMETTSHLLIFIKETSILVVMIQMGKEPHSCKLKKLMMMMRRI